MSFKTWLIVAIVLFGIGIGFGLMTPGSTPAPIGSELRALEQLAVLLASLPKPVFLLAVFLKNVSALIFSLLLSPLLCAVPILTLVLNGWLIGIVADAVLKQRSIVYLLAGLLPHGIFEIPALLIGEAVAISFGAAIILAVFRQDRRAQLVPYMRKNSRYLLLSVVLLAVAAVLETYITPAILNMVS